MSIRSLGRDRLAARSPCCTASPPHRGSWPRSRHAADAGDRAAIQEGARPIFAASTPPSPSSASSCWCCCSSCSAARRGRLPDRRRALGRGRLHRHADLGARQRAHRPGGAEEPGAGLDGVQLGRHHRHAGGGLRAAGRRRLLRGAAQLGPRRAAAARSSTAWWRWASAPR